MKLAELMTPKKSSLTKLPTTFLDLRRYSFCSENSRKMKPLNSGIKGQVMHFLPSEMGTN